MPVTERQPVDRPLTRTAIFIVLSVNADDESLRVVRSLCGTIGALIRAVGFRSVGAGLSCITGLGSDFWNRLGIDAKPQGLHPFREINGVHRAISTPGDILFHIRANSIDFCFELATLIMQRLDGAVTVQDETHGFKYFDNRDLIGFVDGTENPVGNALTEAVVIGDEDSTFVGGSYVIVQKYLHDLVKWTAIPIAEQERIIGRHKLSDVELLDEEKPSYAHNVLTNITENGRQLEILRDNMPFGSAAHGEFGTYFIGYAREPERIERMLGNMFIGNPPGNYDRLLEISRVVTGSLFFVPSADMLGQLAVELPTEFPASETNSAPSARPDGSLGLGSLKQGN